MISPIKNQDFGLPAPVLELTMEQQFKLKQIENALRDKDTKLEDVITIFMALQRQNFTLCNTVSNLVKKWPTQIPQVPVTTSEETLKFGTSSETKGWTITLVMQLNTSAVLASKTAE